MKNLFQVLFVCSGNICRSPMAEGILRAILPDHLKSRVQILSAGTLGIHGSFASPEAIEVSKEIGVDIRYHSSQGISTQLIEKSHIIFALAEDHLFFLKAQFPEKAGDIYLLKAFDADENQLESLTIEDPIGMDLNFYRQCVTSIENEIDRILPKLVQLIEAYDKK